MKEKSLGKQNNLIVVSYFSINIHTTLDNNYEKNVLKLIL